MRSQLHWSNSASRLYMALLLAVLFVSSVWVASPSAGIDFSKAVVGNMYYEVENQQLAPDDGKPHPFTLVWKNSDKVAFEPLRLDWTERIASPDKKHTASVFPVVQDSVRGFGLMVDGRDVLESRGRLSYLGIGSWSADSKRYVFSTYDEPTAEAGLWEIYDIGAGTEPFKVRKITKGKDIGHLVNPRYTPDGLFVSYVNQNWLRLVDLRSKRVRAFFHGAKAGVTIMTTAWSPTGERVALGSFSKSTSGWIGRIAVLELMEP